MKSSQELGRHLAGNLGEKANVQGAEIVQNNHASGHKCARLHIFSCVKHTFSCVKSTGERESSSEKGAEVQDAKPWRQLTAF